MTQKSEAKATEIRSRIGIDASAATEALSMIADAAERGAELPAPLASYLAAAIRRAIAEPSVGRATTLLFELGLTAPAKVGAPTKHVDYHEVRAIVEREFEADDEPSEATLAKIVCERFFVSPNTARKHIKLTMFMPRLMKRNGLKSLLRPSQLHAASSTE